MMDYILENLSDLKELQKKYEKKKKDEKKAKKDKEKADTDSEEKLDKTGRGRGGKKGEADKNLRLKAKRTDTSAESKLIIRIG